jgi:hypothetical protein
MTFVVYTQDGEVPYSDCVIEGNAVLTGIASNGRKTIYGPAGWLRVEVIQERGQVTRHDLASMKRRYGDKI